MLRSNSTRTGFTSSLGPDKHPKFMEKSNLSMFDTKVKMWVLANKIISLLISKLEIFQILLYMGDSRNRCQSDNRLTRVGFTLNKDYYYFISYLK